MKKTTYSIVGIKDGKTTYTKVTGYKERINLSNGLDVTVGLRKIHYWHVDDYLTGLAVTTQAFDTRREALGKAKEILEAQRDNIREVREYYANAYNITFNTL